MFNKVASCQSLSQVKWGRGRLDQVSVLEINSDATGETASFNSTFGIGRAVSRKVNSEVIKLSIRYMDLFYFIIIIFCEHHLFLMITAVDVVITCLWGPV